MWMRLVISCVMLAGCAAPRTDTPVIEPPAPDAPLELRAQLGHTGALTAKAVSPVNELIVTGSTRGDVLLWNTTTGRMLRTLRERGPEVTDLVISHTGDRVAVADASGVLSLYPIQGGDPVTLTTLSEHDLERSCVAAFAPRPDVVAMACDASVVIWDTVSGKVSARLELEYSVETLGHTSRDSVLIHTRLGEVFDWGLTGEPKKIADLDTSVDVAFSPDGAFMSLRDETTLSLAATRDGATSWSRTFAEGELRVSAFEPGGDLLWFDVHGNLHALDPPTLAIDGPFMHENMRGTMSTYWMGAVGDGVELAVEQEYGLFVLTRQGDFVGGVGYKSRPIDVVQTSASGRLLMWISNTNVKLFDLATLDLVHAVDDTLDAVGAALSPSGRVLASWSSPGYSVIVKISNVESGAHLDTFYIDDDDGFLNAQLVSDEELWTASRHYMRAWRVGGSFDTPTATFSPQPEGAEIESFYATRAGDPRLRLADGRVGALGADRTITRWLSPDEAQAEVVRYGDLTVTSSGPSLRLERGGATAQLSSDGAHWAMWTPDGLFAASAEPDRILHGVQGDRVVDLDQLALERNRPDVVFTRLGLGTPELREALASRWAVRLARAGLTAEGLADATPRPHVRIASVTKSPVDEDILDLVIEASSHTELRSVQVSVNGVGVFVGEGAPLEGRRVQKEISVRLGQDHVLLEASVFDTDGRESIRDRRTYFHGYHPSANRTLYFMGFGVSDYASDDIVDLGWAHQDARDLADAFGRMDTEGSNRLDRVVSRSWVNAEVTPSALAQARALLEQSTPDDVVVLFIAGHGMYSAGEDPTYHFLTHDTDLGDLGGTALRFDQLEGLLDGIGSRRKLMLMDTCQSGELDEPMEGERARGVASSPMTTRAPLGSQHKRYIWRDLRRRTGAIVISSSRGDEPSIESDAMRNGAFTEAILEAITDETVFMEDNPHLSTGGYRVTIESLRDTLTTRVPQLTKDRQHPVVDRDNVHVQFELPQVSPLVRGGLVE